MIKLISKIKARRLRRVMRGYRLLKQSGRITLISQVREALSENSLGLTKMHFSPYLVGENGCLVGEIVVRQYLLVRVGGYGLNQALLFAFGKPGGKVIYPLPKAWRKTITNLGVDVANLRSSLLWQLYICSALLYGILQIAKIFFCGFKSLIYKRVKQKKYIYFANLSPSNLPLGGVAQKSHNVISWYLQWKGKIKNIRAIHHSVPDVSAKSINDVDLVFQKEILPPLIGWIAIFKYAFWGINASFIALLDFFRGRWWHAFILNQAAQSEQVRCLQSEFLADEYLFHNSGWIYRPLWTYDAEKAGSIITFYFYSTNCEPFKNRDEYDPIPYGWKAISWSRYLVWDDYQADFIRRSIGEAANIIISGPIWFSGRSAKIKKTQALNVAIFDVTPIRSSTFSVQGHRSEFYTPPITKMFFKDILGLSAKYNLKLLWKKKREIGRGAHPAYRNLLNQIINEKNIIIIDPEVSVLSVIESSSAVISMPFTSVAIMAKNLGKPSVYFDPSKTILKDDRAAHGIQVIHEIDELEDWLKKL
jgi:polysaccharide biosynthesis PFTS motif protein